MKFVEQNLEFDFGSWIVERYETSPQHVKRLQPHLDSEAIDFVAWNESYLVLVEVKDFRGYAINNKNKFGGSLATTVGRKVRDSVAGIVGLGWTSDDPAKWRPVAKSLSTRDREVRAILLLEQDLHGTKSDHAVRMAVELKVLKNRLDWLGAKVFIADIGSCAACLPGVVVTNLKGAAGHKGAGSKAT